MNTNKITDYESLNSNGIEIGKIAGEMEAILENVSNEIKKLGSDDSWNGTTLEGAMDIFRTQMAKFPNFVQSVNDCSTFIKNAYTEYKAAESANNSASN